MYTFSNKIKKSFLLMASVAGVLVSCNKDVEQFADIPNPSLPGVTLAANLAANPNDSLFLNLVKKAGLLPLLSDSTKRYTLFVPDNNAVIASFGGSLAIANATIAGIPVQQAAGLVSYNILPQEIDAASISTAFPNFEYPCIINPAPTLSPFVRLSSFPSRRAGAAWVNNIPVIAVDQHANNGVIHNTARVVAPPTQFLWDRISTDPNMTYMKAAIYRADSGVDTTSHASLLWALKNFGPNFNVFVPSDNAFKQTLTYAITQALIPIVTQQLILGGATPAQAAALAPTLAATTATTLASSPTVFSNPLLYGALSAQNVKGIAAYHIFDNGLEANGQLRPGRAFTVNFPTTATSYHTLLNSAIAVHPGVSVQATFTGPVVSALTVKGLGNAAAANVSINPTPNTGTSDQLYVNGVLHVIDQVLLPQ